MHTLIRPNCAQPGGRGTIGVYSRTLTLPACSADHSFVLAIDRGIHRHAIIKVSGKVVGEHVGYLTPFEAVLDAATVAACNSSKGCDVEITLDGGRNPKTDGLMGACDEDTDGTRLGGWVGLNGHVEVYCRPPTYIDGGVGNTIAPHVTHPPVNTQSSGKPLLLSVSLLIAGTGEPTMTNVEIVEVATNTTVAKATSAAPSRGNVTVKVQVPAVKLWSPAAPNLYRAIVTLTSTANSAIVDSATTRFGVRTIATSGYAFTLNGARIMLSGYGDDSIYPDTVSPPRVRGPYEAKVAMARAHGFNFVRHHSHVLPPEYFDVADELGLLVSPELPCAYGSYYDATNDAGKALYLSSWRQYVQALRHHPSVFDWAMCNEYSNGISIGPQLYDAAKALDPGRLVIDADGIFSSANALPTRRTLDFYSVQFDIRNMGSWGSVGLDHPHKYSDACDATTKVCRFTNAPARPVISHETGNYNTFPRLDSLIAKFNSSGTTIRPYWLSPARDKLAQTGLLSEVDAWALASERLYALCWKIDVEDQRRNTMMSGYEWWLIQDFWTGSNGITDTFQSPKPGVAGVIAAFNGPTIFLQDGLQLSYASKEALDLTLSLSHFGEGGDIAAGATVRWTVWANGLRFAGADTRTTTAVRQGTNQVVASMSLAMPDAGTTLSTDATPVRVTVTAELVAPAPFASVVPKNHWNTTVFPIWHDSPTTGWNLTVTQPDLLQGCGFNNCLQSPPAPPTLKCEYKAGVGYPGEHSGGDIPCFDASDCCTICKLDKTCVVAAFEASGRGDNGICHIKTTLNNPAGEPRANMTSCAWPGTKSWPVSVYLSRYVDDVLLETVRKGSVVVLLQNSSDGFFPSAPTRYKQAWWLGNAVDNNAGTLVYDHAAAILGGMAPDKYADQTWWRLIEGAQTFLVDDFPIMESVDVMMRAIDIVGLSRNKALLFQMKYGEGYIVATGLKTFQPCTHTGCTYPEKAWVMDRLLRHASTLIRK